MKITKFKKYISWNIISLTGYIGSIIAIVFMVMLILAGSQLNMRADLNSYFFDYIINHIINPYFTFYKSQLAGICFLLILSVYEDSYYKKNGKFGLRLFEDNEKGYSIIFFTGLILNFLPLYVAFQAIVIKIMKIF